MIGAAGMMGGYSMGCALSEKLVALADVDEKHIAKVMRESVKDVARPRIFYDYRKMLDECHDDIDVVLISTPDHHHAPAAMRRSTTASTFFARSRWPTTSPSAMRWPRPPERRRS